MSTTASDGWMRFDSDSIGTACGCAPSGYLQSEVINCSAHSTVRLNFENYYRSFNDSCFVWVGTSSTFTTGTYTVYPVSLNNTLATNSTTANPSYVHMNITAAAAGQSTVYLRFVYYGASGGSYQWNIDDVNMTELDPHDVSAYDGFAWVPDPLTTGSYNSTIVNTPLTFVDSLYPVMFLANYGANSETNVPVTANIYSTTSSTPLYTDNRTYASLVVNSLDSIVQFKSFKPTATGSYFCALSATVTGDADVTNDVDTIAFKVTDTVWQVNQGNTYSGYYLHRASTAPVISYMQGARFDVPSNVTSTDTISGFGVAFGSSSVPTTGTAKVSVQLYSITQDGTGWNYLGTSKARAITAADISSSSSLVWAYFGIDEAATGSLSPFVLQAGNSYAAIVQINGVTTDLLIEATTAQSGTGWAIGYLGQSDSSLNDGSTSFSPTSAATGNPSATPLVRMYFGNVHPLAVTNVNTDNNIGEAFPNPANHIVTVPFTFASTTNVNVTLTNITGQVMATQSVNAVAGQSAKATFSTANLPAGVYMYTVEANGSKTTGRVSVAH